jgi:hypothetical protein
LTGKPIFMNESTIDFRKLRAGAYRMRPRPIRFRRPLFCAPTKGRKPMSAIHVWMVIAAFLGIGFTGPGVAGAAPPHPFPNPDDLTKSSIFRGIQNKFVIRSPLFSSNYFLKNE